MLSKIKREMWLGIILMFVFGGTEIAAVDVLLNNDNGRDVTMNTVHIAPQRGVKCLTFDTVNDRATIMKNDEFPFFYMQHKDLR